jgi:hypothetical protein
MAVLGGWASPAIGGWVLASLLLLRFPSLFSLFFSLAE